MDDEGLDTRVSLRDGAEILLSLSVISSKDCRGWADEHSVVVTESD